MKLCVVLIGLAVFFSSCTKSVLFSFENPGSKAYEFSEIHRRSISANAKVQYQVGGQEYESAGARNIKVESDSVSFYDLEKFSNQKIAVQDLREIKFTDHVAGGVEGAMISAVLLMPVALIATSQSSDDASFGLQLSSFAIPVFPILLGASKGKKIIFKNLDYVYFPNREYEIKKRFSPRR